MKTSSVISIIRPWFGRFGLFSFFDTCLWQLIRHRKVTSTNRIVKLMKRHLWVEVKNDIRPVARFVRFIIRFMNEDNLVKLYSYTGRIHINGWAQKESCGTECDHSQLTIELLTITGVRQIKASSQFCFFFKSLRKMNLEVKLKNGTIRYTHSKRMRKKIHNYWWEFSFRQWVGFLLLSLDPRLDTFWILWTELNLTFV